MQSDRLFRWHRDQRPFLSAPKTIRAVLRSCQLPALAHTGCDRVKALFADKGCLPSAECPYCSTIFCEGQRGLVAEGHFRDLCRRGSQRTANCADAILRVRLYRRADLDIVGCEHSQTVLPAYGVTVC